MPFSVRRHHLSDQEKIFISRHLEILLKAGVPIAEALNVLAQQTTNKQTKVLLTDIRQSVEEGKKLAQALQPYEYTFGALFLNLVAVAEKSGTLEENFRYLAAYLEKASVTKKKIIAALSYPALVLFASTVVGIIISFFVLPQLIQIFQSFEFELPLTTRILLSVSLFLGKNGVFLLFAILGVMGVISFLYQTQLSFRKKAHHLLITLPLIGTLLRNSQLEQITRNIGTMLQSGSSLSTALEITTASTTNLFYKQLLRQIENKIQSGDKLSGTFEEMKNYFPLLLIQMIAIGEKSGQLSDTLLYLADFFARENENSLQRITSLLEPLLLLFVGLIVSFIALSVISPIYSLISQLQ